MEARQNSLSFRIVQASLVECYSNHIITQISIQTTGLTFSGTGLCSYCVRGVDGSCAKDLTVESYTVIMLITVILIIFPSPTHSFIPGLKPSFSANASHCSLSFSSSGLTTWTPQTVYCYFCAYLFLLFLFYTF